MTQAGRPLATAETSSGQSKWTGRLLIILAAVLWSTSSIYVRHPVFEDWPQDQQGILFAFWRSLFAGILLLPLARRPQLRWNYLPLLACFFLMNVTFLSAMVLTTVANAIWLQNIAPAWVFLANYFLFRQKPTGPDLRLLGFGVLGALTILGCEFMFSQGARQTQGVLLGVGSGIFYAGVVICLQLVRNEDSAWMISLSLLATAALLGPFVLSTAPLPTGNQLLVLAAFGLLQMGVPYVCFARGLRSVGTQEAAGIVLLEPILNPLWVIRKEQPAWWTWLGATLILLGLGVRYLLPLFSRPRMEVSTVDASAAENSS